MGKKERLDKILTDLGYFDTKSRAQAAIMTGDVKINDETITKSGYQIKINDNTKIEIKTMPFVSRGGFKLDKAIKAFDVPLNGRVCLDAGASTGGFTDCMLQQGAKFVYAVDVGYGQLAWKLRQDARVKVIERTNIKNCSIDDIYSENDEKADLAVMDLSFISIKKVLKNIAQLLTEKYEMVALIKPQFEAGREQIGKNGVVRDKNVHFEVIDSIINFVHNEMNVYVKNLSFSPIKGPKGNIEYLIYLSTEKQEENFDINKIINEAFEQAD